VVVGIAGIALAGWLLIRVVDHGGEVVYDLPPWAVALGVVGAACASAGCSVVAWRRDGIVLGAAFTALLLVAGIISIFSIGILLLIAFAVAVNALVRRASSRGEGVPARLAFAVAALVGLGLPAVALVAASDPVVTCLPGGAGGSTSMFRSGGGDSGRGTSSGSSSSASISGTAESGGVTTGEMTVGGRRYRYRCDGVRLVKFESEDTASN
jgi:hypothetical protein